MAMSLHSPGKAFRAALTKENPCRLLAPLTLTMRCWRSVPDIGDLSFRRWRGGRFAGAAGSRISTLDDVLTDIRRITDVCSCRCWWMRISVLVLLLLTWRAREIDD